MKGKKWTVLPTPKYEVSESFRSGKFLVWLREKDGATFSRQRVCWFNYFYGFIILVINLISYCLQDQGVSWDLEIEVPEHPVSGRGGFWAALGAAQGVDVHHNKPHVFANSHVVRAGSKCSISGPELPNGDDLELEKHPFCATRLWCLCWLKVSPCVRTPTRSCARRFCLF